MTREEILIDVANIIFRDRHLDIESKCNVPLAQEILEYLHSQGVVIKVDRELPEIKALPKKIFENRKDTIHTKMCYLAGVKDYQAKVKEAGYVAVEPLIGEPLIRRV